MMGSACHRREQVTVPTRKKARTGHEQYPGPGNSGFSSPQHILHTENAQEKPKSCLRGPWVRVFRKAYPSSLEGAPTVLKNP